MTRARVQLISLHDTPYYHCISRCVRRAFLCGEDKLTGKNYDHRKQWVIERLHDLDQVFSIDLCAYAQLANHTHLVLRVDRPTAQQWDRQEVAARWRSLFALPLLVRRYCDNEPQCVAEREKAEAIIDRWRDRLADISWFMRCLNEYVARRANAEDQCTGRFWEGRFKSQALLDEGAVLTCMSYVDLNPIRAKIAETPESSDFTSIQQRIREVQNGNTENRSRSPEPATAPPALMPLVKQIQDTHPNAIGFTLQDYLELVDWAGRHIVEGKRGYIPERTPPILRRLELDPDGYLEHIRGHRMIPHPVVIGQVERIRKAAANAGLRFLKGMTDARRLYISTA